MAKALVDAGSDLTAENELGMQPPAFLAFREHEMVPEAQQFPEAIRLLQEGGDFNAQTTSEGGEMTPIMIGAALNAPHYVDALLQAKEDGVDIDLSITDINGHTALDHATDNYEIGANLLDHGLDPNHENNFGETSLFHPRDPAYLNLLVERGGNVNHQNEEGVTPLGVQVFMFRLTPQIFMSTKKSIPIYYSQFFEQNY